MAEKIWMVGGSTGKYLDRREWVVDAWRSEEEAKARVRFLTEKMQELGATPSMDWGEREKVTSKMRKHDAAFLYDFPGTSYYICEMDLKP